MSSSHLPSWYSAVGVQVHPNLRFAVGKYGYGGFVGSSSSSHSSSTTTTQNTEKKEEEKEVDVPRIPKGSCIASIPYTSALSEPYALSTLHGRTAMQELGAKYPKEVTGRMIMYLQMIAERANIQVENHKPKPFFSPSSIEVHQHPFTAYLQSLPKSYDDVACWPVEQAKHLLAGTNLEHGSLHRRRWLRRTYDVFFPALSLSHPLLFPSDVFTWNAWVWAHSAFSSRGFPHILSVSPDEESRLKASSASSSSASSSSLSSSGVGDVSLIDPLTNPDINPFQPSAAEHIGCMLPVLDILNHGSKVPVEWIRHTTNGTIQFIAGKDYLHGEEVLNNYGGKSNEELLLAFGFVLENNQENDTLSIAIGGLDEIAAATSSNSGDDNTQQQHPKQQIEHGNENTTTADTENSKDDEEEEDEDEDEEVLLHQRDEKILQARQVYLREIITAAGIPRRFVCKQTVKTKKKKDTIMTRMNDGNQGGWGKNSSSSGNNSNNNNNNDIHSDDDEDTDDSMTLPVELLMLMRASTLTFRQLQYLHTLATSTTTATSTTISSNNTNDRATTTNTIRTVLQTQISPLNEERSLCMLRKLFMSKLSTLLKPQPWLKNRLKQKREMKRTMNRTQSSSASMSTTSTTLHVANVESENDTIHLLSGGMTKNTYCFPGALPDASSIAEAASAATAAAMKETIKSTASTPSASTSITDNSTVSIASTTNTTTTTATTTTSSSSSIAHDSYRDWMAKVYILGQFDILMDALDCIQTRLEKLLFYVPRHNATTTTMSSAASNDSGGSAGSAASLSGTWTSPFSFIKSSTSSSSSSSKSVNDIICNLEYHNDDSSTAATTTRSSGVGVAKKYRKKSKIPTPTTAAATTSNADYNILLSIPLHLCLFPGGFLHTQKNKNKNKNKNFISSSKNHVSDEKGSLLHALGIAMNCVPGFELPSSTPPPSTATTPISVAGEEDESEGGNEVEDADEPSPYTLHTSFLQLACALIYMRYQLLEESDKEKKEKKEKKMTTMMTKKSSTTASRSGARNGAGCDDDEVDDEHTRKRKKKNTSVSSPSLPVSAQTNSDKQQRKRAKTSETEMMISSSTTSSSNIVAAIQNDGTHEREKEVEEQQQPQPQEQIYNVVWSHFLSQVTSPAFLESLHHHHHHHHHHHQQQNTLTTAMKKTPIETNTSLSSSSSSLFYTQLYDGLVPALIHGFPKLFKKRYFTLSAWLWACEIVNMFAVPMVCRASTPTAATAASKDEDEDEKEDEDDTETPTSTPTIASNVGIPVGEKEEDQKEGEAGRHSSSRRNSKKRGVLQLILPPLFPRLPLPPPPPSSSLTANIKVVGRLDGGGNNTVAVPSSSDAVAVAAATTLLSLDPTPSGCRWTLQHNAATFTATATDDDDTDDEEGDRSSCLVLLDIHTTSIAAHAVSSLTTTTESGASLVYFNPNTPYLSVMHTMCHDNDSDDNEYDEEFAAAAANDDDEAGLSWLAHGARACTASLELGTAASTMPLSIEDSDEKEDNTTALIQPIVGRYEVLHRLRYS